VTAVDVARTRRRRRFRLVAALATSGVALAATEVGLRLAHLTRARRADPDGWHEFDPTLGWRAKRGWTGEGRAGDRRFSVRTNGRGLREDREVADRPAPGVARVTFVGDSFVFGYGCEVEEGTVARVESALLAAGLRAEALNLGTCAFGVDQMRLVVERDALALAPRLILVGVIDHDFRRALRAVSITGHRKPRFVLEGDDAVRLVGVPVPPPPAEGVAYFEDEPPDGGTFVGWKLGQVVDRARVALAGGDEGARLRWRLGRALLLDAARVARERGARLAVVLFPVPKNLERGEPLRELLRGLEPDIPVCDLYPAFERAPDRRALFLEGDDHPSPAGHAVAADALARFVLERRLLE
jgi:hypothetical protein